MKRPVNLDITTMWFPITAIISILHRVSGVILFLAVPVLLYFLDRSLISPEGFARVHYILSGFFVKLMVWALLLALVYHLLAGIRHLIMDMGIGENLKTATASSWWVFVIFGICAVLLGVWLWA